MIGGRSMNVTAQDTIRPLWRTHCQRPRSRCDAAPAATPQRFSLSGQEGLLLTFSAGVVEIGVEEAPEAGLKRAYAAMYLAKRAGKNRVVAG